MPESGVDKVGHSDILSLEQLFIIAKTAVKLGIDKIRVTGGEPFARKNADLIFQKLGTLDLKSLAVTTNGTRLKEHLSVLKDAGVAAINVSLDTLDKDKYAYMSRTGDIEPVIRSVRAAADMGFSLKINAVYMRGFNDKDLPRFLRFAKEVGAQFRYIELMPFPVCKDCYDEFGASTDNIFKDFPSARVTDKADGTARICELDGVEFGVISSLSHAFCSSCNRIRVTCRGELMPCLHSDEKTALKPYLEDESALEKAILEAVQNKPACHRLKEGKYQHKSMNGIGG